MSLAPVVPYAWIAATFGLLFLRKRYPVATIALTGASTWLYYVSGYWGPLVPAPALAVFSLGRRRAVERRRYHSEQERLRIAREVHDVVAHSLAMINVQAGVAAHVADRKSEEAVKALLAVKEASRAVLVDLRATLGALRSGEGTAPAPSLKRLDELLNPVELLRAVAAGEALLAPSVTKKLIAEYASRPENRRVHPNALRELTDREREVLALVAGGLSNDEIAEHLVISPAAAPTHVSRTMTKSAAGDRAQLVVLAYESGLATPKRL